ncbi:MAG: tetratricopeptide repeat protein, partial [Planctomycetota bacterium]
QNYNRLIKEHPTSDKIDDAAYKAGVIMEEFKDYVVALDYYQSAYKWDPETIHPARFRAARILDKQLHRYAEALELYQEAIRVEARFDKYRQWKEYAEMRIREIQKLDVGER